MKYEGSISLNATKDQILKLLDNPDQVAQCFPGIKSFTKEGEEYKVVGVTGIGFIKGEYKANVRFEKIDENKRKIIAKGTGMNSNVDIDAIAEALDGKINYSADVKVAGVLASVGARLMGSALEKIINDLFNCIKERVIK
ncbi:carbon monoxide dehydrogenase subunit G [Sulfolobus islandicus Y.G.57.14]|jgi:carbon monoxide dehydrogenase subunit G|uniref:Carbon monoxide dehydrogenase subunit G n=10 Tax=Saccharolobus islandicus TaxID=43080 RepID=M9U6H7_SACIS|nr:CoxG family protein [Sulfolobus islandicus]ACP34405.1 carbon monoxide dehydrogenase subunit G [Sulfolobus islandicus L.S.2.15]ACP37111.1 carbon monoxide dehydrogenase subunit G [Sulfolobus islandicus M.14.25]ACP44518.1 carbon monoxide dehydrogenase subunit G [Sulfolobus islandicus Y.G.57.14]ACP49731.1 carbon monoxide dehydrogenase subunit G [Sulfolobus islandicus Y.N.15.51]ACP54250.1 carbon monoxide dehydrogenase subunit G [Sulfolobus islandicus M.16.27]